MENKKSYQRGPRMLWLDAMEKGELIDLFTKEFFDSDYKKRSAFKQGTYRVSPEVAIRMGGWWSSFGVTIRLHQIRPDIWGGTDRGPDV